jgi:CheY-like chemotaxis protein
MPKTILLVEDTDDIRQMMTFALQRKGYNVVEATDGYQAVDLAIQHTPDLILMDMSLPMMDGLTAARLIKGSEKLRQIPIIVITAHSHFYAERALEAGCDAVITKPIDFTILDEHLAKYI